MSSKKKPEDEGPNEAVVAVFERAEDASRISASMRRAGRDVVKVSLVEQAAGSELPELLYDEVEEAPPSETVKGPVKCAAIGAVAGLTLIAVPGLNLLAPIAGSAAGVFIGSIAGVDETERLIDLPNERDYREAIKSGKSVVAIFGSEADRIQFANEMKSLGVSEIHQHPPVRHAVRKVSS